MTAVNPDPRERLSHPAQGMIGTSAKWWPEMPRADVNIGKRSQETPPKTGSISGFSAPQLGFEIDTRGERKRGWR